MSLACLFSEAGFFPKLVCLLYEQILPTKFVNELLQTYQLKCNGSISECDFVAFAISILFLNPWPFAMTKGVIKISTMLTGASGIIQPLT